MAHTQAAVKVGTVVVLATVALAALGYFFFGRSVGGYPVDVTFKDAQGIQEQADVFLSGVKVGAVQKIRVDETGQRAVLRLRISPEHSIPVGSTFTISSGGLLGEMSVYIAPPTTVARGLLPKSEDNPPVVQGKDLPTFDQIKEQVAQLGQGSQVIIENLQTATGNMAKLTNDPVLRSALRNTALNAETISAQGTATMASANATMASINRTVGRLNSVVDQEVPTLQATLRNIELTSRQGEPLANEVKSAIKRTSDLIADLKTTSQFARETLQTTLEEADAGPALNRALKSLADTAEEMKAIAINAHKISDDLVGTDAASTRVGALVNEVGRAAGNANVLLEKITGQAGKKRGRLINGTGQIDVYQRIGNDTRFRADANLAITRSDNSSIILGLRDIGEGNRLNLQNSVPVSGRTRLRYGFHASKLGMGADWNILGNPSTPLVTSPPGSSSITMDLYDPNDTQLDIYGRHQVNDKLGIVVGMEDVFDHRHPTIGLTYRP